MVTFQRVMSRTFVLCVNVIFVFSSRGGGGGGIPAISLAGKEDLRYPEAKIILDHCP